MARSRACTHTPPTIEAMIAAWPGRTDFTAAVVRRRFECTAAAAHTAIRNTKHYLARHALPAPVQALMDEHGMSEAEARYCLRTHGELTCA